MKRISREAAKAAGCATFYTGIACPQGHLAPRQVVTGSCLKCSKQARKQASKQAKRINDESDN